MNTPLYDPAFKAKADRRLKAIELIYGLMVMEDLDKWLEASSYLGKKMSENELKGLAYACLRSLPIEEAVDVVEGVFAPFPEALPKLDCPEGMNLSECARMIIRDCNESGVKALAMQCVKFMPPRTQISFAKWLKKKFLAND